MTLEESETARTDEASRDDLRLLALTMERMAGEISQIKSRLDRSESLLEAVANRLAALASRDRPQPVTKEDLQPVLTGLLRHLERQDRSMTGGP
ncbi:MAG: hypothetical protein AAF414_01270 [Pseudomonadota bacterium]